LLLGRLEISKQCAILAHHLGVRVNGLPLVSTKQVKKPATRESETIFELTKEG
jgi:hypothetical protein